MAFQKRGSETIAFCDIQDVLDTDLRLFSENESLTEDLIYVATIKATGRVLDKMRASEWWQNYFVRVNGLTGLRTRADIPPLNASRVISRQQTFTEMTTYFALSEYLLPLIADFSNENNAEYVKIKFYADKGTKLFDELIAAGDWYDFNGDGITTSQEKEPSFRTIRRIR